MSIPFALVWHQHQPYYKDLATSDYILPWVRLHGIKDYYGMARLLADFPGVRCSINLVPSMLVQLDDYVRNGAADPFLRRTRMAADSLAEEDVYFLLDHFFMAQWDRMIRIHPRYAELLALRRMSRLGAAQVAADFDTQALRDLQVWFNLAWFHPVCFEESETLRILRDKGRDFSEDDKAAMLGEHDRFLARVIPLHRELAQRGQVELTTTPFYHPILPLLCDIQSVREALPNAKLPKDPASLKDDAEEQIRRAVAFHREQFGVAPRGMWPSEGSVSPEIVPLIARHGIEWIATDEEILEHSLGQPLRSHGKIDQPGELYRPWRVEHGGGALQMVFRDHNLSDRIGFHYQSVEDGHAAALDFLDCVNACAGGEPAGDETLVTVILDGENCWEHYPNQGVEFLRGLYANLENESHGVKGVRVCDFLRERPASRTLPKLFRGSWINHNFYIWAGHSEDRRAWEYLYRVRADLAAATKELDERGRTETDTGALTNAWEELLIAEGSDWCWWYGDDHSSGNDSAFDLLFRTHLKNVYVFLGRMPPEFLDVPIKASVRAGRYTLPTGALAVKIDGRATHYFEWLPAGRYRPAEDGGTMTAAGEPLLRQIFFGYEPKNLCVRIDLAAEPERAMSSFASAGDEADIAREAPAEPVAAIRLRFPGSGQQLSLLPGGDQRFTLDGDWPAGASRNVQVCWRDIVEMRVPFALLGVRPGDDLDFFVEVSGETRAGERYPRNCAISLVVPPEDIHEHEWIA
jgi:alpha-amylase/alpha-mannosidase (GH57 family)